MIMMAAYLLFFVITLLARTAVLGFDDDTAPSSCPQSCTCSPNLKRVSCIGRGLREIPSGIPRSVTELYLSNNKLTVIPGLAFDGLSNLTTLSLKQNHIAIIDDEAFSGLKALKVLYLTNNELANLSTITFRDLVSLVDLYISQNLLTAIPDLQYARSLRKLAIDNNRLKSAKFGEGFVNLTSLSSIGLANNPFLSEIRDEDFKSRPPKIRKINLSRCGLKKLGKDVFSFPHLQALSLSYNPWWNVTFAQTVISSLTGCRELESLDLSGTIQGSVLPPDFFQSLCRVPLKTLNLANITVSVINGSAFSCLRLLEKLDLSQGQLSTWIGDVSMPRLQRLTLAKNKKLESLPNLLLPSLTFLDLRGSPLTELSENVFTGVPRLDSLVVADCGVRIVAKSAFTGLTKLKSLDLSRNAIGGSNLPVKVFSPLENLRSLDLSRNNMGIILQESNLFQSLVHLELLNLSENQCSALPPGIFDALVSLRKLDLSNNKLGESVIGSKSGSQLFAGLRSVESIDLRSNSIDELPPGIFDSLLALGAVNLAGNGLTTWNGTMFNFTGGNVTTVDFSSNRISIVTQPMIEGLLWNSEITINLTSNPFACWCDLRWFRLWIAANVNSTKQHLVGLSQYKCNSPESIAGRPLIAFDPQSIASICLPPPWMVISIAAALGSAVIVVGAASVAYRKRWWISLRVFYIGKRFRRKQMRNGYQNIDELEYDVLVSYFPDDDSGEWVRSVLVPTLEGVSLNGDEAPRRLAENPDDPAAARRLFYEERDVEFGENVLGVMDMAMKKSKKLLIVASEQYAADGMRRFQMEMIGDKWFKRVVLVLWGDESVGPRLPGVLHGLCENRALVWTPGNDAGIELFWNRLDEELNRSFDEEVI